MTTGEANLSNGACKAATYEARRALYDEAAGIIAREYASELRLSEVARRIAASERALQRAFYEHGQLSFSAELRARRLEVAARLLRGTDLPISAVARRVGYGDHAPFTRAFGRHHGLSPREYGASNGNGNGAGRSAENSSLRDDDHERAE